VTESTRADVERAVRYQLRKWLDGDEAAFLDAMDDAAQYYARRQANRTTIHNCERDSRYYTPGGLGTAQANRRYGPLAQATAFYGSSRGGTRNPRRGRRHSLHAGDIAYARVPTGAETCTYCMMLASRGFAYRSEQSAGHADHRGCNCLIVAGVHGSTTVEGVDIREQYDTWREMATADARHDAGELSDGEWQAQKRAIVDAHPNATAGIDAAPGREGGNTGERVGWYVPQEYEGYGTAANTEPYESVGAKLASSGHKAGSVIMKKAQFGKKARKHCSDWGLDVSKAEDRKKFEAIIEQIIDESDQQFQGEWRSIPGTCTFYQRGDDVVIVNEDDEFVTVMRGGASNKRVTRAREGGAHNGNTETIGP